MSFKLYLIYEINYNYAGKYNLHFHRAMVPLSLKIHGFFPSAAFHNINRKILRNSNTISNLKLRISYGQTANQGACLCESFINGNTNYVLMTLLLLDYLYLGLNLI